MADGRRRALKKENSEEESQGARLSRAPREHGPYLDERSLQALPGLASSPLASYNVFPWQPRC